MKPLPFTGAVLAGGESRRMGRDKALLALDGELLWRRQARVLQLAGAITVGIVRRPDQPALETGPEFRLWHDTVAGIGPLAGLHAALVACETEWLAILATDMPEIDAAWFHWLAGVCRPGCGAIVQHGDGGYEPLAAIYPRTALPEIIRRLPGGPYSLHSLASTLVATGGLGRVHLPVDELWRVTNWNKPQDATVP